MGPLYAVAMHTWIYTHCIRRCGTAHSKALMFSQYLGRPSSYLNHLKNTHLINIPCNISITLNDIYSLLGSYILFGWEKNIAFFSRTDLGYITSV